MVLPIPSISFGRDVSGVVVIFKPLACSHQNRGALIRLSTYRGLRHFKGLPVRGQRTKTNSKTVRRVNRKF